MKDFDWRKEAIKELVSKGFNREWLRMLSDDELDDLYETEYFRDIKID